MTNQLFETNQLQDAGRYSNNNKRFSVLTLEGKDAYLLGGLQAHSNRLLIKLQKLKCG